MAERPKQCPSRVFLSLLAWAWLVCSPVWGATDPVTAVAKQLERLARSTREAVGMKTDAAWSAQTVQELEAFLQSLSAQTAYSGTAQGQGVAHVYGVDLTGRAFYSSNRQLLDGVGLTLDGTRQVEVRDLEQDGVQQRWFVSEESYVLRAQLDPMRLFLVDSEGFFPLACAFTKGARFTIRRVFDDRVAAIAAPPVLFEFFSPRALADTLRIGDSVHFSADTAFLVDSRFVENFAEELVTAGLLRTGVLALQGTSSYLLQGTFDFDIIKLPHNRVRTRVLLSRKQRASTSFGLDWSFGLVGLTLPLQGLDTFQRIWTWGPTVEDIGVAVNRDSLLVNLALRATERYMSGRMQEAKNRFIPEPLSKAMEVVFDPVTAAQNWTQDLTGLRIFGNLSLVRAAFAKLSESVLVMDYTLNLESPEARLAYTKLFSPTFLLAGDTQALAQGGRLSPADVVGLQDQSLLQDLLRQDASRPEGERRVGRYSARLDTHQTQAETGLNLIALESLRQSSLEEQHLTLFDENNRRTQLVHIVGRSRASSSVLGKLEFDDSSELHAYLTNDAPDGSLRPLGYEHHVLLQAGNYESARNRVRNFLGMNLDPEEFARIRHQLAFEEAQPASVDYRFILAPDGLEALAKQGGPLGGLEASFRQWMATVPRLGGHERVEIRDVLRTTYQGGPLATGGPLGVCRAMLQAIHRALTQGFGLLGRDGQEAGTGNPPALFAVYADEAFQKLAGGFLAFLLRSHEAAGGYRIEYSASCGSAKVDGTCGAGSARVQGRTNHEVAMEDFGRRAPSNDENVVLAARGRTPRSPHADSLDDAPDLGPGATEERLRQEVERRRRLLLAFKAKAAGLSAGETSAKPGLDEHWTLEQEIGLALLGRLETLSTPAAISSSSAASAEAVLDAYELFCRLAGGDARSAESLPRLTTLEELKADDLRLAADGPSLERSILQQLIACWYWRRGAAAEDPVLARCLEWLSLYQAQRPGTPLPLLLAAKAREHAGLARAVPAPSCDATPTFSGLER